MNSAVSMVSESVLWTCQSWRMLDVIKYKTLFLRLTAVVPANRKSQEESCAR